MSEELSLNDDGMPKPVSMTSKDIAALTRKQHKHVLDDCRKMFEELELQSADFSADYKDGRNRTQSMFDLNQELMMTLVTGYSTKLRNKVVARWMELETKARGLEMKKLQDERDNAIRQRGLISTSREATLMSKLANLSAFDMVDAERVAQLEAAKARGLECPDKEIADTLRSMLGVKRLPKRPGIEKPADGSQAPRAVNQALIDLGYQEVDRRVTDQKVKGKLIGYDHRYKPLHVSDVTMQATYAGAILTIISGGSSRYNFRVQVSWKWSRDVIKPLFEYMQKLIRDKQQSQRGSKSGE